MKIIASVTLKVLRDQSRSLVNWGIGLVAMAVIMSALYPSIAGMPSIDKYIQEMPEGMMQFLGGITDYSTPSGYFGAELYSFMVPLLFLIFGIGFGAGAIAGEEEKGTMDFLLANPVPRWSVVVAKFLAMTAGMLLLGLFFWAGMAVCVLVIDIDISLLKIAEATFGALMLALVFSTLALFLGSLKGNRGMALGLSGGIGVLTYLLNALGGLVDSLKDFRFLSPFYHYMEPNTLKNGIDPAHLLVLVGLVLLFLLVSIPAFTRRDIAV